MSRAEPVELACQRLGSGKPLLVLHGLFGSGTNWRGAARAVAECREVFLLDARNHGASPHVDSMDYRCMAEDVRAFMDRHAIASADVVGHSMGGKTAMQLALGHPERVRRLMVVDIAPAASPGDNGPLIELMRGLPMREMTRRSELDRALAEHIDDAALRAFLGQNAISRDGALAWRINLEALAQNMHHLADFPLGEPAPTFEGTTLFVAGACSDYLRDEHHAIVVRLFPNHRIERIDGAGHWVHAEQAAAFNAVLREFLDCGER